jgi:hypothetical protein
VALAWYLSVLLHARNWVIEPSGEVVSGYIKRVSRLVSRVDLRMHYVRVGKCDSHEIMYMSRKTAETCFVAHEAMDVHKK